MTVDVLLANNQPMLRDAMKAVLEANGEAKIAAEASNACTAVDEAERTRPDVVLLDADLPRCDGIRTVRLIRERAPGCRVLVQADEDELETLADALEAGADGVLGRRCGVADLAIAVRAVHAGDVFVPTTLSAPLLAELVRRRQRQADALRCAGRLTRREREVLSLVVRGLGREEVAARLVISPETARTHIQHVVGKLGVHSRREARSLILGNTLLEELLAVDTDGAAHEAPAVAAASEGE